MVCIALWVKDELSFMASWSCTILLLLPFTALSLTPPPYSWHHLSPLTILPAACNTPRPPFSCPNSMSLASGSLPQCLSRDSHRTWYALLQHFSLCSVITCLLIWVSGPHIYLLSTYYVPVTMPRGLSNSLLNTPNNPVRQVTLFLPSLCDRWEN